MKGLNKDLLIGFAIIALAIATALIFTTMFIFDVSVSVDNSGAILGIYSILTSFIWAFLILRNC
ncbi:MAG: hypothetical protein K5773_00035 [Pseudobutyrivibrio sp.]|nr:hypothetical protein [Pseudobutyrivibrio sp.]